MPEEIRHPDGRIEHPHVRHEKTDANFRWILGLLVAALLLGAFIHWVVLMFLDRSERHQAADRQSSFPLAGPAAQTLPREPRLEQIDRVEGIARPNVFRREVVKESALSSYGPTGEKGYVHIPIDQAMTLLEKKLPVRTAPPAGPQDHDNGLVDAGEPNSGRLFRRRP